MNRAVVNRTRECTLLYVLKPQPTLMHSQLICLKIIPSACSFTKISSFYIRSCTLRFSAILTSRMSFKFLTSSISFITLFFLFTSYIKTDLPNVSKSQLTSTNYTNIVVDLILLLSAIIIPPFINFLTKFIIFRVGI